MHLSALRKFPSHVTAGIYSVLVAFVGAYAYLRWINNLVLNHRVIVQPVLLLQGYLPYTHIADQKTPLLPDIISWLLPIFGGNAPRTARFFHSLVVGATILLVLVWLFRARGWWATAIAGVFYLAWANRFGYWAIAYYDMVLGLLFFAAFALMAQSPSKGHSWELALLGAVTGVGILIKQQAGILALVIMAWIAWRVYAFHEGPRSLIRYVLTYLLGCSLQLVVYGLYYAWKGGDFGDLFYWTVQFNLLGSYASQGAQAATGSQILQVLPAFILLPYYLVRIGAPTGPNGLARNSRLWLMIVFLSAFIMLYPRYSARHLATSLPCLTAITGISCADLLDSVRQPFRWSWRWFFYAALGVWWFLMPLLLYLPGIRNPAERQFVEYSELVPLADALNTRLPDPGGLVLIPLDEGTANLYYFLRETPPGYYLVFYPWFINDVTVERWLRAVDGEKPQTVIYFKDRVDLARASPAINEYVQRHYQLFDSLTWQGTQVEILRRIGP
jgi:hypothetical protein